MLGQVAGQLTSQSITTGSIYALVGVGFVILFGATGLVNFAQGEFMVLGAYFFYGFKVELHQNSLVVILAALIAMIALGIVVNMVIFYRLFGPGFFPVG